LVFDCVWLISNSVVVFVGSTVGVVVVVVVVVLLDCVARIWKFSLKSVYELVLNKLVVCRLYYGL
jgi:hypothetical protein